MFGVAKRPCAQPAFSSKQRNKGYKIEQSNSARQSHGTQFSDEILFPITAAMATPSYDIRVMRKEEVPQALEIWKETGLHEGTQCLYTWLEVDPDAFHVAVTEEGEVLGVCSAVILHEDLAFVGLYAVRKQHRAKGIGVKLWKACYNHIGDRNAAVNAVPGKLELYRDKGGFPVEETGWLCIECESNKAVDVSVLKEKLDNVEIQPLTDKELPLALDYDFALMGFKRDKALTLTIHEKDSVSFLAVQNSKCVGYGTIKLSVLGHGMIGPLYAENQCIAEVLLRKLIQSFSQCEGFAMMTITANQGARDIISKLGVTEKEECPRCYKKYKLNVNVNKVFGHLDLNFSPF